MRSPLVVAAWPAFRKARENRYTALFAQSLADRGVDVREFRPGSALRRHDVVVVHWPEIGLNRARRAERLVAGFATLAALTAQRVRGAAVVWVTHNVTPHDERSPRLNRVFYAALGRVVTGLIHPSVESRAQVVALHPPVAGRPSVLAPHGVYPVVDVAVAEHIDVLRRFRLGPSDTVVLFFGQIREYKGVPDLLEAARRLAAADFRLVIVGQCSDSRLGEEIEQLAALDSRVRLSLALQDDSTLAALLERANLVVLPFRRILNSGSVVHALSAGRRVACPFIGSIAELAGRVGPSWMRAINTPVTTSQLEAALDWATTERPATPPCLREEQWDEIGRTVSTWMCGLVTGGRSAAIRSVTHNAR